MEKKILWSSGASAIVASLLILGGLSITDEKNYGCEARAIIMPCDSLSQYYGLPNGKCNNAEFGNKLCSSGWNKDFKIIDETILTEEARVCEPVAIAYVNDCATGKRIKYFCEGIGAGKKCRSTDEILSELG